MNANTPLMLMGLLVGTAAASGGHALSSARSDRELQAPGAVAKDILGTVQIPRHVRADGKSLAAGTYQVRETSEVAKPGPVGQLPELSQWVEFLRDGEVRGREIASLVPQSEMGQVAKGTPPPRDTIRVDMLRGNDYLRIWINRGDRHYLIHLPLVVG